MSAKKGICKVVGLYTNCWGYIYFQGAPIIISEDLWISLISDSRELKRLSLREHSKLNILGLVSK